MADRSGPIHEQIAQIGSHLLNSLQQWCSERPMYADGYVLETRWSSEFGQILNADGIPSVNEGYYPGSKERCDLIVHLGDGSELWLEVKGAWLIARPFIHSDGRRIGGKKNPSYSKHLFGEGESSLKDVAVKLPRIAGRAKYVAFLLVGFDSIRFQMDKDIEDLEIRGRLNSDTWARLYQEWPNPLDHEYRIRCWFWYRPAF